MRFRFLFFMFIGIMPRGGGLPNPRDPIVD